ncbi:cyclase family protein [Leptodesmis sichuanensis]|uniref:cyclase family protein n=1 Tax=Leptodesmis sichuanensis TaxID=2906798 RepID=UPI0036F3BC79
MLSPLAGSSPDYSTPLFIEVKTARRSLDLQADLQEMIMPLVVIDVHEKVVQKPDYTITMAEIKVWEAKHGLISDRTADIKLRSEL